jgi:hypothetical protein
LVLSSQQGDDSCAASPIFATVGLTVGQEAAL